MRAKFPGFLWAAQFSGAWGEAGLLHAPKFCKANTTEWGWWEG